MSRRTLSRTWCHSHGNGNAGQVRAGTGSPHIISQSENTDRAQRKGPCGGICLVAGTQWLETDVVGVYGCVRLGSGCYAGF